MDFIEALFTDFSEIHGDRAFGDDSAMSCGMAHFNGEPVLVVGNLKGRTLKERVARKFGSPDPEGYRKALRCMKIAEKFGRPIFTFIDLAGANPGIGAEERGQGEAIARNLIEMSRLRVPTIATITGEGGSGGALALAVADRVLMLENAIYSVNYWAASTMSFPSPKAAPRTTPPPPCPSSAKNSVTTSASFALCHSMIFSISATRSFAI
jgi:acetyl-CoA carboxylase carboxyl transferase subunit alpha